MSVLRPRLPQRAAALLPPALHTTARPSATAQWTTLVRALELSRDHAERIVTDAYAPLFLSGLNTRILERLRASGPLVHAAERQAPANISTSVLCRHRFIDAHLLEALPEIDQVVILGAGYDSRTYRFSRAIGARPVYEVDLAPLSRRKAAIIAAAPQVFGHAAAQRVEIDFRTQSLRQRLAASSFTLGAPTFVVWEGVAMYLTPAAVTETLRSLAVLCGRGSVLAMDFWQQPGGLGPYDQLRRTAMRGLSLIGEPVTFTMEPEPARTLLDRAGFEVADQASAARLTLRYSTARRHCAEGMHLAAARLR